MLGSEGEILKGKDHLEDGLLFFFLSEHLKSIFNKWKKKSEKNFVYKLPLPLVLNGTRMFNLFLVPQWFARRSHLQNTT